ncbi:MAG: IPT/TIG domain-containing protein, partial [Chloroflexota bacterium]|nr:IPT/TIG domain-containing protein [Chloroflexota bacterium]
QSAGIAGSQQVAVAASGGATLVVSGFPSPAVAGTSGSATVVAKDAAGNIATGYRGTIHFTSTDAQAGLPADYAFSATDQGVHTFTIMFKSVGTQGITATDTASGGITGAQGGIAVSAGPASHLAIAAPANARTGGAISLTLTARDAFGNVATSYPDTVHFASSDTAAVLPANYTFRGADNGIHTFTVNLKTAGSQSVTATDVASNALTATVTITVNGPGIAEVTPISGPLAGGTTVTITGSGLAGATVAFDGVAATNVRVNSAGTSLTCVTPARSGGATVDVTVSTGMGTATARSGFTYLPPGGPAPLPNQRPSGGASLPTGGPPPAALPASR